MSKLLRSCYWQGSIYLIISCLIFPLSLKTALFCGSCFFISRIFLGDRHKPPTNKLTYLFKIALSVIMMLTMSDFYLESRIHFYPVSEYDYLWVIITALIVKLYPLQKQEIKAVCLAIALSPLIVFISHVHTVDFVLRNNWAFDNANGVGMYCAICLPLIVSLGLERFKPKTKVNGCNKSYLKREERKRLKFLLLPLLIISFVLCLLMLVSSGSRSSLYTTSLSIFLLLSIYLKSQRAFIAKYNLGFPNNNSIFLSVFGFLGLMSIFYQLVLTKFTFISRFINLTNSTNLYRTYIYQCYWQLGLAKPWWGWGIDRTSALCEQSLKARYGGVNHAHNFILQIFADHGAIATLICLIVIGYFMVIPSLKVMVNYNGFDSPLNLGICLACLSILTISLFQSAFYHYPLFPLWLGLFSGTIKEKPE